MRSGELGLVGLGALCALAVSINAGGCQSDDSSTGATGPGGTGAGGNAATSTGTGTGGGTTSTGTAGGESGTGGSGGAGAPVVTIEDITQGTVGEGVDVQLSGAVAMSQKFFVSKGQSGSCLWGVFLSSPGDGETTPYSGILALSYGTMATTQDNGEAFCPKLGQEPVGDAFPDDVKPGDVLDVAGETSYFLLNQCATQPADTNPSQVKQRQLAQVRSAVKVGETTPRTPHLFSGDDVAKLASATDTEFHDMWGGVKVRIENVSPVATPAIVDRFGAIRIDLGASPSLEARRNVYYRPYSQNFCHEQVQFADGVTFASIEGFSSVFFCIWILLPNDKCADFDPSSTDCSGATECQPDALP
jgi:hypothetical protein